MQSSSSCARCGQSLAVASDSGLCPVCLLSDPSRPASAPPVSVVPAPGQVETLSAGPAPGPDAAVGETATGSPAASTPPGRTTAAEPGGPRPLPPAPPGYEMVDRLGGGGMGEVFLARDLTADRLVAMKFLRAPANPDAVDRFLTEVRAQARLDHPHIVRVMAPDFYRADPFFTMEYLPGGTLAERVARDGPLDPAEAARLVATVARAVDAAHRQDVLHRDLKPANVLLTADGSPKVSDFGLAKRTDQDDQLTVGTGPLGTPSYMPPEQISRKNGEVGPASDVYGLGATLYHLLTGQAPFTGGSREEAIHAVLSDPPERPRAVRPGIPMALEGVVVRCLEKDPADRYPTAAALADDLDRFLAGELVEAPQLTRWRRARWWLRRHRPRLAAALAVALLVAGGFALARLLAPVPKHLTQPDPAEVARLEAERMRRELAAGRAVTLIGKTGLPRRHTWPVGATVLTESPLDGACEFETIQHALLELLDDPEVERYRVTASLRIRQSKLVPVGIPNPAVGASEAHHLALYFGHSALLATDGMPAHAFLGVAYNDYLSVAARQALVQAKVVLVPIRPDLPDSSTASASKPKRFPPVDRLPGEWRRVGIEVTPDGVKFLWADREDAPPEVFDAVGAGQLNASLGLVARRFADSHPGVTLAVPPWQPRAGIGIWCRGAAVSVRNVVIESLP